MAEYLDREALEIELNHRLNFLMAENGEYDHYTSGFDEAVTRVENFQSADVECAGRLRGVTYEDGKVTKVHIRDTDDEVKVFVPVVRCKDCKHWIECDDVGYCDNPDGLDNYAKPNDFCNYGERRNNAAD